MKMVGRLPNLSVQYPETARPRILPMYTEAVFRPVVAGVRLK
jgi:hypothetical protein